MDDGVFILVTLDGFRVAYSKRYFELVTIEGKLVGNCVKECFDNCKVYGTMVEAMDEARRITKRYHETENGICVLKMGIGKSYDEIVKE